MYTGEDRDSTKHISSTTRSFFALLFNYSKCFQVSVALVQAILLTLTDLRCRYWDCNLHYEDLWLAVLPLLVQGMLSSFPMLGMAETTFVLNEKIARK